MLWRICIEISMLIDGLKHNKLKNLLRSSSIYNNRYIMKKLRYLKWWKLKMKYMKLMLTITCSIRRLENISSWSGYFNLLVLEKSRITPILHLASFVTLNHNAVKKNNGDKMIFFMNYLQLNWNSNKRQDKSIAT